MIRFKISGLFVVLPLLSIGLFSCGLRHESEIRGERGSWMVVLPKYDEASNKYESERTSFEFKHTKEHNKLGVHVHHVFDSLRQTEVAINSKLTDDRKLKITDALYANSNKLHTNKSLGEDIKKSESSNFMNSWISKNLVKNILKKRIQKINHWKQSITHEFQRKRSDSIPYEGDDNRMGFVQFGLLVLFGGAIFILGLTGYVYAVDLSLILALALFLISLAFGTDNEVGLVNRILSFIYLGVMGLAGLVLLLEGTIDMDSVFGIWGFIFGIWMFTLLMILADDPDALDDLF